MSFSSNCGATWRFDMIFSKRWWKFRWQKLVRGWDDSDTWNLDHTIAKFVLPRLKRLKEVQNGYVPRLGEEGWDEVLDKIIFSMELVVKEWDFETTTEEEREHWKKAQEGFELFGKYFRDLWW